MVVIGNKFYKLEELKKLSSDDLHALIRKDYEENKEYMYL